jgi:hypothetical protein
MAVPWELIEGIKSLPLQRDVLMPMHRLREIHDELLQSVGAAHDRLGKRGLKLTTFFPMRGSAATGELMVVGRAVRGWQKDSWSAKEMLDPGRREEIIREVFDRSSGKDGCSMRWVNEAWGRHVKNEYNSLRSAFWRVICKVSKQIVGIGDDWPSKLIWSDLYKVAPHEGGNPWKSLCDAQLEDCKRHLAEEMDFWKPKRVLFLTGPNWLCPFLKDLGATGEPQDGLVQWCGHRDRSDGSKTKIVVCVHPQGRNQDAVVKDIIQSFRIVAGGPHLQPSFGTIQDQMRVDQVAGQRARRE